MLNGVVFRRLAALSVAILTKVRSMQYGGEDEGGFNIYAFSSVGGALGTPRWHSPSNSRVTHFVFG